MSSPLSHKFHRKLLETAVDYKNYGITKGDLIFPKDAKTYVSHPIQPIIEPLIKNLDYKIAKYMLEEKDKHTQADFVLFVQELIEFYGDSSAYFLLAKMSSLMRPCQVQTETLVSNEALFCESKGFDNVSDIPWDACFHHNIIEFFFECPNLPTFLVYKGSLNQLFLDFKVKLSDLSHDNYFEENALHFFAETPCGVVNYFCVDNETLTSLISKDISGVHHEENRFDSSANFEGNFSQDEFPHVADAIMVCLRSIIYANCDPTYVDLNVSKSSLKGGKPNIKGRPNGTRNKIIYAPQQIYTYADGESTLQNKYERKRAWLGKLPYTRKYKADRYTNLKGKTLRYPMCLGKNGENPLEREMTKYIVRKPKTPFKIKS